jgi:diaminopimelate epimerase
MSTRNLKTVPLGRAAGGSTRSERFSQKSASDPAEEKRVSAPLEAPVLPFVKLTAAGNDFVLVDARDLPVTPAELARRVCPRQVSLGADGLLVLDEGPRLRHYEPDGSRSFCLNGARAAAAWWVASGQSESGREVSLECEDEVLEIHVDCSQLELEVSARVPRPNQLDARSVSLPQGVLVHGVFVDVGNPQFVVLLETSEQLDDPHLMQRARAIRWATAFPDGTNVAFVAPLAGNEWRIRSYERGVEGETLSCGTGVLAAACALVHSPTHVLVGAGGSSESTPINLRFEVESGETQRVCFPDGAGSPHLWATGPVRVLARGELWGDW